MSKYIQKRSGTFYFRRRVPQRVAEFECRTSVKVSLETGDQSEAMRKAAIYNDYIEDYWRTLVKANGHKNPQKEFKAAVKLAKAHGFAYKSIVELTKAPVEELMERLDIAVKSENTGTVEAVLGGKEVPIVKLSNCDAEYWPLCADRLIGKNEHQVRKWKNPRMAALKSFIEVVGDIDLAAITRTHVLSYRQWWMDRIQNDGISPATVNKRLVHVRDMFTAVGMIYEIETNFKQLFADVRVRQVDNSRPPFEAEFVQDTLLNPRNLQGLNEEAKLLIYTMADTGARESELVGLMPEDIFLEVEIPYIWIRPNERRSLKTESSERKIPLVGSALHAMKRLPDGFSRYEHADGVSTAINKYLRENNLKPSDKHSLYSLRHTFKDRLRDIGAPEEVIDELMGHHKSGPKYGRGHILDTKLKWLEKIAYKVIS